MAETTKEPQIIDTTGGVVEPSGALVKTTPAALARVERIPAEVALQAKSATVPDELPFDQDEWAEWDEQGRIDAIMFLNREQGISLHDLIIDFPKVTFPTGGGLNWTLPNGDGARMIEGVIIWQNAARAFYISDQVSNKPPDCSSINGQTPQGGFGPVQDIKGQWVFDPKRPGAKNCADCPLSKYGTDRHGRGQACKQRLNVFIWQPGTKIPIFVPMPPTSIRPLSKFIVGLVAMKPRRSLTTNTVILGLEKKQGEGASYAIVAPSIGNPLRYDQMRMAEEIRAQFQIAMTKRGVTEADAAEFAETAGDERQPGDEQVGATTVADDGVPF
jgi:hypothetical protein